VHKKGNFAGLPFPASECPTSKAASSQNSSARWLPKRKWQNRRKAYPPIAEKKQKLKQCMHQIAHVIWQFKSALDNLPPAPRFDANLHLGLLLTDLACRQPVRLTLQGHRNFKMLSELLPEQRLESESFCLYSLCLNDRFSGNCDSGSLQTKTPTLIYAR
jgi:hypothetical protein